MTTSNDNEKTNNWLIYADRQVILDVSFSEPVTYEEAKKLFNKKAYEDIMDEEVESEEFVDADPL